MLSTSAETMVVGPNGRVFLKPSAMEILLSAVRHDERLSKTTEELEISMIVKVPEDELGAFCEVVGTLLDGMSPAELASQPVQELAALYSAHYLPGRASVADVA
jgi:methyl coenzyme M reductase subunit C-like uncharacterized protein (methanogenesis marker protein 7)